MAVLTFYGAAQEVTGSCYLLESPAIGRVLLDCGVRQGGDAIERVQEEAFLFDPQEIDAVILSHAHLDHSGMLPMLARRSAARNNCQALSALHSPFFSRRCTSCVTRSQVTCWC